MLQDQPCIERGQQQSRLDYPEQNEFGRDVMTEEIRGVREQPDLVTGRYRTCCILRAGQPLILVIHYATFDYKKITLTTRPW